MPFTRPKTVIGRKVQNCHPPASYPVVEKILKNFKEGKKDAEEFWINLKGKLIYIRYFAVRDEEGNYVGTLEVTQEIGRIKELQGEKRLLED
ncbi:PAS domain-containing protein [Caldanaerovirga acetigignens]|uniref:PAS domain-containing protein n=1 Tax=Caldanaerovirga acetigignens TaxID=447595 RepID=A0A1M7LTY5_9FIRM|nr:PAS domain-containing protein [Caldanaerovirga acetigignens]SHM81714.1 PAS domain-containing protein [Caldanaerovirga acetigignens]